MAYSSKDWEIVRAFYERGLSLNEIIDREEVNITDRSTISKKAKSEGWERLEKSTLLAKEILAKQDLAEVQEKKFTLNSTELDIHNNLVVEKMKNVEFFDNSQKYLAKVALEMIKNKNKTGELAMQEVTGASRVVRDSREGVVGKAPEVQIVNNQVSVHAQMSDRDLLEEARRIQERMKLIDSV